ncbi:MAG: Gfo/Idh/MocA family oxidoreductase [Calditrichaeota bacterium]|nr:Gfo/Idh/MocA family oxidoreductase [Calditrichota bacterium]
MSKVNLNRRTFLKKATFLSGAALSYSSFVVPFRVFGQNAPSEQIRLGCIGLGRMGSEDLKAFLEMDDVLVTALCDVDKKRAENARQIVQNKYTEKYGLNYKSDCRLYKNYQEVVWRDDIDAVMVCTPDHWHAVPAIAAAKAGKDIFLQKPLTYTIGEGRNLANAVKNGRSVFQVGSQQRSDDKFRFACELVQNRMIGDLKSIEVGFGIDPVAANFAPMSVPDHLDYQQWLGPAPQKPYTEKRVHPDDSYNRPGWMTIRDYSHGMITNWGAHHIDIAHWGMGLNNSGPEFIEAWADYPKDGLFDVHQRFYITYTYPNGIKMIVTDNKTVKQGVLFKGTSGWVYVKRGYIDAYPKSLLNYRLKPDEIHLYKSTDHKRNFVNCIKNRSETVAPVENAHRSNTACVLGSIAMKLKQPLQWDYSQEKFTNNEQANRLLARPVREYA